MDSSTPRPPQGLADKPLRQSRKRRHSARRRSDDAGHRDGRGDLTNGHAIVTFGGQGEFTEKASAVLQGTRTTLIPHTYLHINTFRSHDSSSHRTAHHERATFHCSVTHSLRLKTDVKHEFGQLSLARVLLNTQGCGRHVGIRVGEAQNPGPVTHDRDWTVTEHSHSDQRSWRHSAEQPGLRDEGRPEPAYLELPCGTSSPASPATANNEEFQKTGTAETTAQGVQGVPPRSVAQLPTLTLMQHMGQKHGGQVLREDSVGQPGSSHRSQTAQSGYDPRPSLGKPSP